MQIIKLIQLIHIYTIYICYKSIYDTLYIYIPAIKDLNYRAVKISSPSSDQNCQSDSMALETKGGRKEVFFNIFTANPQINSIFYSKITDQKALIEKSYFRIDVVEKFLAAKEMDEEQRSQLESELSELKEILKRSEKELEELHFSNRETTKIAFIVIFIIFFIYCIYALISNENQRPDLIYLLPRNNSLYLCL